MKVVYFILLLLCTVQSINGQSTISGIIIDEMNKEGLGYATVALYQEEDSVLATGTITNESGEFILENLAAGVFYLEVKFLGYQVGVIPAISVGKNASMKLEPFTLSPNERMLEEIVVTGDQLTVVNTIDREVFSASEFQNSMGGTATDLIGNLPSITLNVNGEILARGTSGFMLLINDKPIQGDPKAFLNQLPANAVHTIELITAPSAKYDPEGTAGIINILTKEEVQVGDYLQVNTRLGLPSIEPYNNAEFAQRYGLDFTYSIHRNKWDVALGGSYFRNDLSGRRVGDVFTISGDTLTRFASDGERSFDEINYSGRMSVSFKPSKKNMYSIGVFGGKRSKDRTADILYFDNHAVSNGNRIYTTQYFNENLRIRRSDFALASFDYSHVFNDGSNLTSSFLYEYTLLGGPTTNRNLAWPETTQVVQDEFNTNDNPLRGIRYQVDYQAKSNTFGSVEIGYQFRQLDHSGNFIYERRNNTNGQFELVPDFSSEVDLIRTIHSGYGLLSAMKKKWNYSVGIRIETMDRRLDLRDKAGLIDTTYRYDFIKPFPSANIGFQLRPSLTVKGAYSRRVQRTTTFKMNPFPEREHSETLEQGDPTLLPEFTDLIELGMIKDFKNHSIYSTAYYRNTSHVVNRVNTVFNDTILNRIYSNVGKGRTFGLETGADLSFNKQWSAFIGTNVYHYTIEGQFNNLPVSTESWIYSVNANATWKLNDQWLFQWVINYLSARNTAQGEDSRFYNPSLSIRKSFMQGKLRGTLQWLSMDLGILRSNEQRITTFRPDVFFTTTNYVYEVDRIVFNLSYTLNSSNRKTKFIKSEFGAKEF